jgi:putative colanic acid biosynthesis UDP-glucose lipid carrier transferase
MPRDVSEAWLSEESAALREAGRRIVRDRMKRLIDILGALAGLVLLAPVFTAAAVAVMVETPGSPMFTQRRTGHAGKPFVIYKFRSMRVSEDGPNIEQAARRDDRITRVGRFLRRTSLDELPQLLNVLKGEMSLVGPRPHALAHDEYYGRLVVRYDDRFSVKPGLTGLAQVSGLRGQTKDVAAMAARVDKDIEYIASWSLLLDLKILLGTVFIFAFHPAAF